MISLLFGDVFRYNEKEYIFLARTQDITYAAEILNPQSSSRVDGLYQKKLANGTIDKSEQNILYCYVILQTKEFKDRAAHFAKTGKDGFNSYIDKLTNTLDTKDLQSIIDEISTKNVIPEELKELIKSIKL